MAKKEYMLHDALATQDSKVELLLDECGAEGYGMYWMLLEALFLNDGFVPEAYIRVLARKANISREKAQKAVKCMVDVGLIHSDGGSYCSKRLLKDIEKLRKKREQYTKNINARWAKKRSSKVSEKVQNDNSKEIQSYNERISREEKSNEDCNLHIHIHSQDEYELAKNGGAEALDSSTGKEEEGEEFGSMTDIEMNDFLRKLSKYRTEEKA